MTLIIHLAISMPCNGVGFLHADDASAQSQFRQVQPGCMPSVKQGWTIPHRDGGAQVRFTTLQAVLCLKSETLKEHAGFVPLPWSTETLSTHQPYASLGELESMGASTLRGKAGILNRTPVL